MLQNNNIYLSGYYLPSENMTIPDYQSIMLPLLKYIANSNEYSLREAIENLSQEFNLTEEEKKELLPSGQQPIFSNRVGWAKTYLKKAGLIATPRRGFFQITELGRKVLQDSPLEINNDFLNQFSGYLEFKNIKNKTKPLANSHDCDDLELDINPQESIESGYQQIRQELEIEILHIIKNCSSEFFEKLVVDLLISMGYGGSRRDAGKAIGKTGDGGIDGIIKEDKLGLDIIYVQAKKWDKTTVGRPEIQKFVGALHGYKGKKGVFITTSKFSQEAKNYVSQIDSKIVLIDGNELAELMIDNNVGVATASIYEIKKIDSDYFANN